jgi:hypothetical protein
MPSSIVKNTTRLEVWILEIAGATGLGATTIGVGEGNATVVVVVGGIVVVVVVVDVVEERVGLGLDDALDPRGRPWPRSTQTVPTAAPSMTTALTAITTEGREAPPPTPRGVSGSNHAGPRDTTSIVSAEPSPSRQHRWAGSATSVRRRAR